MKLATLLALLAALAFALVTFSHPAFGDTLGDVVYTRAGGGGEAFEPAYFPHWVHRIKYKCYVCHDSLFPMSRGTNPTMDAMSKGESCGACHNGKVAFAVDMCQRCHAQQ